MERICILCMCHMISLMKKTEGNVVICRAKHVYRKQKKYTKTEKKTLKGRL